MQSVYLILFIRLITHNILHVYRLLTDQFCITEDCLNKFHKCLTKIYKTIGLSILFGLFQVLVYYYRGVGAKFEVVRQILRLLASFIIRKVEQM